jgi:hypothetical protein
MATFHGRRTAGAAFVLVLLLGVSPSWAARPGAAPPQRAGFQGVLMRIVHLVLGPASRKTESTLAPNGGSGNPPSSPPGGASPDIGNSLDPLG